MDILTLRRAIVLCICLQLSLFSQPYKVDTLINGLFRPVAMEFLPNDNVIITGQTGPVRIYSLSGNLISTFWNFSDSCVGVGELGTLGICLDPDYNNNHFLYIYYIHAIPPIISTPHTIRVVRLTESNGAGINPQIIFNHYTGLTNNSHVGGNLRFGADDKLYITIGEHNFSSQFLTNPYGKIIRLNRNGTIPTDNPFYDDGNPNRSNDDRIWALGLRNTFDFCFSPINDSIYATENGDTGYDEVNFIRKGKNYGWPICEGYCVPYNPLYRQPMAVFSPASAFALTGIMIYNGSLMPELYNSLFVAPSQSFGGTARIMKCYLGNQPFYDTVSSYEPFVHLNNLTTLMQGPGDYIYALGIVHGKLYRIGPVVIGINTNNILIENFSLSQNYPNPFNPSTSIKFEIPTSSFVSLKIYNVLGMEVTTLLNEHKHAGSYEVSWDASNSPSGVYFYELVAGEYKDRKKMVLIK